VEHGDKYCFYVPVDINDPDLYNDLEDTKKMEKRKEISAKILEKIEYMKNNGKKNKENDSEDYKKRKKIYNAKYKSKLKENKETKKKPTEYNEYIKVNYDKVSHIPIKEDRIKELARMWNEYKLTLQKVES
jgi:hypothetical protein